jgi:hypothetical protein
VRIVVVSDTHLPRFSSRFGETLRRVAEARPDLIVHCGDHTTFEATTALATIAPVEAIAGNNDPPQLVERFGRRKIVEAAGVRIGLVHGDGIKGTTLGRALAAFAADDLALIAFGHSHVPYCERHDRTWVLNPGSPTDKRRQARYSFAIVERAADGALEPRLVYF